MQSSVNSIKGLVALPLWHTSTVKALMVYVREVLEANNLKNTYKFTNLYCNWCVHVKISESITAFAILRFLTEAICKHNKDPHGTGDLSKIINAALGLQDLQKELIDLFQQFKIDSTRIQKHQMWKAFVTLLLQQLKEKPIAFSYPLKPKFKKIHDGIVALAASHGQPQFAVIALSFTDHHSKIYWEIKTDDLVRRKIRLVGAVAIPK